MADDIINSGTTDTQKTVTQRMQEYADTDSKLRADHAAASEVMNSAMAELEHGRQQNTEFTNSGINTTVAKDANGNAIGTYDWDAQAEHQAKIAYNSEVLSAKQDANAAKQELITNQQQGQTQHDMASYSANQSAEKAGWTGGYILDSNRQVAFLKESIKANLYSQEELQKYGYDTALAAARAMYDLKKSELAVTYYNDAVQNAFKMAEFTGKFVSPEASYHLSQRGVAEQILATSTNEAERLKAQEVISAVDSWFEGNDISKEGVYCISVLMQNWTHAATVVDSIGNFIVNNADAWDKFNAMVASNQQAATTANTEDAQKTGIFSYVDEYGNTQKVSANWTTAMVDGTMPEGFDGWSSTAKAEYKSILGNVIAGDLKNKIETDTNISGKNFADEASAKAAIHNAIVDNIAKYSASGNISDVNIAGINVDVTINGTKMSIPVAADSMSNYKNYKKSETTSTTTEPKTDDSTGTTIDVYGPPAPPELSNANNGFISLYSDSDHLKGINNVKEGQNFHIQNRTNRGDSTGTNWNLELWNSLSAETARTQGLKVDSIHQTGIYYVNNSNGYMQAYYKDKKTSNAEYAKRMGTAYYVVCDNSGGILSINVIGSQRGDLSGYIGFIKAIT